MGIVGGFRGNAGFSKKIWHWGIFSADTNFGGFLTFSTALEFIRLQDLQSQQAFVHMASLISSELSAN